MGSFKIHASMNRPQIPGTFGKREAQTQLQQRRWLQALERKEGEVKTQMFEQWLSASDFTKNDQPKNGWSPYFNGLRNTLLLRNQLVNQYS